MDYYKKNGKRTKVTEKNRQNIQDEVNDSFGFGGMSITFEGCEPAASSFSQQEENDQIPKKERPYAIIDGEKVYSSGYENEEEEHTFDGKTYDTKRERDDAEEDYWEERKARDEEYYGY